MWICRDSKYRDICRDVGVYGDIRSVLGLLGS